MTKNVDIEIFTNGPIIMNTKGCLEDLTKKLNEDLSEWVLVKVPIKIEPIDELTETIKYEYRYRLYLSKVYELLGLDNVPAYYSAYYWEKDKDGNITDVYLP